MKKIIKITESELKTLIENRFNAGGEDNTESYKQKVITTLNNFNNSYKELTSLWSRDYLFNLDLNNYLSDKYPFKESFDEFSSDIDEWVHSGIDKLSNISTKVNETDNGELESKYQIGNKFLWIDERKEYSIEDIEMKGNTFYYLLSDSTHYISEPSLDELIEMDEVEFLG